MGRKPCCEKIGLKKGPWTPEEDQKLVDYIQKNGYGNWRTLPKNAGLERCGKSCRLRWTNYLRPDIKRGRFCFEEEKTIIHLHSVLGNKWSAIAARLPGRTDNEIKNYWNTHIRKKLLRMGIDPVTHSPRLDLLDLSSILINSSPQMNLSRLLGLQQPPFLNPELLRLATPLSSSHPQNPNFLHQNVRQDDHQNQISTHQMQNPFPPSIQLNPIQEIPNAEPISPNSGNFFGFQNCQINGWERSGNCSILGSNLVEDCDFAKLPISYSYYGSGQSFMGSLPPPPPSENSAFQSSCPSNNFNLASVLSSLSTPSSSPSPLDSHSNFCDCCSAAATAENERESYCGDTMLKFEIPDLLDVNEFMSRF